MLYAKYGMHIESERTGVRTLGSECCQSQTVQLATPSGDDALAG